MKQYITFEKEALENNLRHVRDRMFHLDSEIRVLEDYGQGKRIPQGIDADYWKRECNILSRDMRIHFDNIADAMAQFGFNINFDFEKEHKEREERQRKVLIEKTK